MSIVATVLLIMACLGTIYYILSTLALISHFRKTKHHAQYSPMISVLKPVRGIDADAESNFDSYLDQQYEGYEVFFGVLDADDPAIPLISNVIKGHSNASLFIGSDLPGANNKVRILHNLAKHAQGEILIITDADTRVEPDALSKVVSLFEDESVGVVTCMYRGIRSKTIADALEELNMTCIFEPGVACAKYLHADFGLGALIAIRRSTLDAIGGFEAIADYLADDYQLAHRASRAGFRVELSDYVVDIVLSGARLRDVLLRELRWAQTQRICNPVGYVGLAVTFGFAYAVVYWIISGFSLQASIILLSIALIRFITAYIGAYMCLSDYEFQRHIYLLPLRDLLSLGIWAAAFFVRTVRWRGRRLKLTKDGKMRQLDQD